MKNYHPKNIILIGAAITFVLSFLSTSIVYIFSDDFSFSSVLLSSAIISVGAYLIFIILIQRFIDDKLKLLYRVIGKGKKSPNESLVPDTKNNLKEAEKETEKWVNERQNEIARLKEQEAFRREFLGNLAHELKTPVFSIQGYILTLLEGGLEDESVNRKFLERASKATDRITSILNDLDEITKMEVNRFELHITTFDIVELAQEVMDSFDLPASEKGVVLKFNKKYESIFVNGDRPRISQVFTNLIANSIHYGKENGTTTIRFYPMDDVIMTEVSDNGSGIEEKDIPRLFERFYRVEQSRNRNEGGSGLGLAIVKHIIETLHKQTIAVRSTPQVGSTFAFTLAKAKK